ncbi:MAG: transcription termination/antitermination protein NusA, partial [Chloroflexota bacterium]
VLNVELNEREGVAAVVVPDRQLSLAIGKEGQNVRLAAKLTGWRIDIKSASEVEEARLAGVAPAAEAPQAVPGEAAEAAAPVAGEALPEAVPVLVAAEVVAGGTAPPLPVVEGEPVVPFEPLVTAPESGLRFAEDILGPRPPKPGAKTKKKKKVVRGKDSTEDGVRLKKVRHERELGEDYLGEDESTE